MMIELLFYAVFLSQIFLLSIYYPKKIIERNLYVLNTYPAAKYPKLYLNSYFADPEKAIKRGLRRFAVMNGIIAIFGLGILASMAVSGYLPSTIKENENLIFVMFFFALQMVPHLLSELSTWRWYKLMREARAETIRTADLKPRLLFDFISPVYVALAVSLYVGWLVFYIYIHREATPWAWNQYVSIFTITAVNLLFVFTVFRFLRGQKIDPYQASQDRQKHIGAVIKSHVYGSIGMSLFLILMELVNVYHLDKFEPVFLGGFLQVMAVVGLGTMLRSINVKDIDFSVYKEA
ncbi:MAG: hypothetical protein COA84_06880 [Robiginitomaculum sp.]|nr:MAG: hypothetical protein COA84_06880 [Robiginitomaculum sp.]